jgi:hypothetical protein
MARHSTLNLALSLPLSSDSAAAQLRYQLDLSHGRLELEEVAQSTLPEQNSSKGNSRHIEREGAERLQQALK